MDQQLIIFDVNSILTVMVTIFIATCMVLVFVASTVAFVFVFTRIRESREITKSLISQRKLDEAIEKDLLSKPVATGMNNDGTN